MFHYGSTVFSETFSNFNDTVEYGFTKLRKTVLLIFFLLKAFRKKISKFLSRKLKSQKLKLHQKLTNVKVNK